MEKDSHEVKIFKDGELVAKASHVRVVDVPLPMGAETLNVMCFHLPRVQLERKFVFSVLYRTPMSQIFNESGIEIDDERHEPVYYIHGRVETFRGDPTISAVVVGKPDRPINPREFVPKLPDLYRRFSELL